MNQTPLYVAAWENSVEIGELLIRKGAAINAKDIFYQIIRIMILITII